MDIKSNKNLNRQIFRLELKNVKCCALLVAAICGTCDDLKWRLHRRHHHHRRRGRRLPLRQLGRDQFLSNEIITLSASSGNLSFSIAAVVTSLYNNNRNKTIATILFVMTKELS